VEGEFYMIPTRPDINEFINYTNDLADSKTDLANLEWELEKARAHNIKNVLTSDIKNKSRAVDYAKVIGSTEKDEKYVDGLMARVIKIKRDITILYGKIEAWKANKDLYRSDSYFQVTSRVSGNLREEEE